MNGLDEKLLETLEADEPEGHMLAVSSSSSTRMKVLGTLWN